MAKYRCKECHSTETTPRPFRFHLGDQCRCHRCGTFRVRKLKNRDMVDPMERGFLNVLERWAGGKLYHCRFCRLQFWDRRNYAPASPVATPGSTAERVMVEGGAQPTAATET